MLFLEFNFQNRVPIKIPETVPDECDVPHAFFNPMMQRIKGNFPREQDVAIDQNGVGNSVFWPGACGMPKYCGHRFSEIDFIPQPVDGKAPTIAQVLKQLEEHERQRGR